MMNTQQEMATVMAITLMMVIQEIFLIQKFEGELSVRNWKIFTLAITGTPDHNDFS